MYKICILPTRRLIYMQLRMRQSVGVLLLRFWCRTKRSWKHVGRVDTRVNVGVGTPLKCRLKDVVGWLVG